MTDAWPRRNLGRSEQWGRTVERRVEALGRSQTITDQTSDGYGRYTTATFDTLSQIADDVERAVSMNPHYFSLASSAQGFGFGGDDWFTVASITAPNTRNFWKGEISAVGTISSLQDSSPVARFIWPFSLDDVSSEYGPRPPPCRSTTVLTSRTPESRVHPSRLHTTARSFSERTTAIGETTLESIVPPRRGCPAPGRATLT